MQSPAASCGKFSGRRHNPPRKPGSESLVGGYERQLKSAQVSAPQINQSERGRTMSKQGHSLQVRVHEPTGDRDITITGRKLIRVFLMLHSRRNSGVSQYDVLDITTRLSAMVWNLHRNLKLDIVAEWEGHDGGQHARYYLRSRVTILQTYALAA